MGFKQKLKDILNALTERHGPFYPRPEVKAKLEEKGYSFKLTWAVSHEIPVETYDVYKNGKLVDGFFGFGGALKQYYADYELAVKECAQEKDAAKSSPSAPEPRP